ncbi:MAG: hypothetical protein MT334_03555 [Candidatus Nitrosopumilus limneticus]|nr:hypothetical protein [Candidatus Nitrosopumilus limneticus]
MILLTILSTALVYAETISVDVDGTAFDVSYTATGMTIIDVESDTGSYSLIFSVDVTDSPGILEIEFERSFFDSLIDGETDDIFFILADGDEVVSTEIQTTQSRSLTIEVPFGTEELEIIGSVLNNSELESVPETVEEPVVETVEEPVVETVDEPVVETVDEPVVETVDEPVNQNTNQCGPGTVLENNVCILDERCGPGTVLENNECVLDSTPSKSSSSGNGRELIIGIVGAFVIAGIVGIIFGLISRSNRK